MRRSRSLLVLAIVSMLPDLSFWGSHALRVVSTEEKVKPIPRNRRWRNSLLLISKNETNKMLKRRREPRGTLAVIREERRLSRKTQTRGRRNGSR